MKDKEKNAVDVYLQQVDMVKKNLAFPLLPANVRLGAIPASGPPFSCERCIWVVDQKNFAIKGNAAVKAKVLDKDLKKKWIGQ